MGSLWSYLETNAVGIMVALGVLVVLALLLRGLAWTFAWGRYGTQDAKRDGTLPTSQFAFVLERFFTHIITEFRHLLALVIVLIFSGALAIAVWPGFASGDVNQIGEGLKAVVAALGGLVGSIIGYYFGESAAARDGASPSPGGDGDQDDDEQPPEPARPPPFLAGGRRTVDDADDEGPLPDGDSADGAAPEGDGSERDGPNPSASGG